MDLGRFQKGLDHAQAGQDVGGLQVLIEVLIAFPVFVEDEKVRVLRVLEQIVIETAVFRAGRLKEAEQLRADELGVSGFAAKNGDNSDREHSLTSGQDQMLCKGLVQNEPCRETLDAGGGRSNRRRSTVDLRLEARVRGWWIVRTI